MTYQLLSFNVEIGEVLGGFSREYEYVACDGGVRIEQCSIRSQNIMMPEFIDGKVVVSIGPYAFEGNGDIREIVCSPQVAEIGSRAFANCQNLERLVFPAGLDYYDNSWTAGCNRLEEIVLPGAIIDLGLVAPAPVGIKRICIGEMTRTARIARAWKARLEHVSVDPENKWLSSDGHCIYNADGSELLVHATKSSSISISPGCRRVVPRAFEHEKHLEYVRFPESVDEIGERAFAESGVRRFEFPRSLRTICPEAFAGCHALVEIALVDGLVEIGERAFADCSSCTSLHIPASVAHLARGAFEGTGLQPCGESASLTISPSNEVLFIDDSGVLCERNGKELAVLEALDGKAERYIVPAGTVRIADRAFFEHPNLAYLEVTEGVLRIGSEAFMGCNRLRAATLPSSLLSVGTRAFAQTGLNSCNVPSNVERIGECAFAFNFRNWHPTTNPPMARTHLAFERGNKRYFVDNGLLYERLEGNGIQVVLYVGPEIDLSIEHGAHIIAPYAFFGVQGIRTLHLPASTRIGEATFAMRKPPDRIVLHGEETFELEPIHDWRGVCALQRAFAGDGTTNAGLLCSTFDEEALGAQADYEIYRYMAMRLSHPEHLKPDVRAAFEDTLRSSLDDACVTFARHDDRVRIDVLADLGLICEESIDRVIDAVSRANSAPVIARLLELKRTCFSSAARDYEL